MEGEGPLLLTVAQARRLLGGIGRDRLYALLRRPDGPPCLRVGRKILVPRDALLRWVEEAARRGGAA